MISFSVLREPMNVRRFRCIERICPRITRIRRMPGNNLPAFASIRVIRGQKMPCLLSQVVLAQIELVGLDHVNLYIRKTLGEIVSENGIIANDDDVAAKQASGREILDLRIL